MTATSPGGRRLLGHGVATLVVVAAVVIGCGGEGPVAVDDAGPVSESGGADPSPATESSAGVFPPAGKPERLAEWGQLSVDGSELTVAADALVYSLNSALFSDYAHKLRTVWTPDGSEPASYDDDAVFDLPVGTVITKTFYYPRSQPAATNTAGPVRVLKVAQPADRADTSLDLGEHHLLETRVLVHRDEGWLALPYVWNEDQTEATLRPVGDIVPVTLVDDGTETDFPYVVPNANQCAGCHATNNTTKVIEPIGPKARHLNLMLAGAEGPRSQLELWEENGLLTGLPDAAAIPAAAVWDDDSTSIAERARAYLDINCAHCHNRVGPADTSGLFLEATTEVGFRLGVCKAPVAAGTGTGGRLVGIHPGEPDDSIFVYRMETNDPGAMMPELGRALTHDEGVELIADWIASLDGGC